MLNNLPETTHQWAIVEPFKTIFHNSKKPIPWHNISYLLDPGKSTTDLNFFGNWRHKNEPKPLKSYSVIYLFCKLEWFISNIYILFLK